MYAKALLICLLSISMVACTSSVVPYGGALNSAASTDTPSSPINETDTGIEAAPHSTDIDLPSLPQEVSPPEESAPPTPVASSSESSDSENNTDTTNNRPVIQLFTYNPSYEVITKNDVVTFKVVAFDDDKDILNYVWTATKGTLSSTEGEVVTWEPVRSDGSLEVGVATITVFVSDSRGGTDTSSVNIRIQADTSSAE